MSEKVGKPSEQHRSKLAEELRAARSRGTEGKQDARKILKNTRHVANERGIYRLATLLHRDRISPGRFLGKSTSSEPLTTSPDGYYEGPPNEPSTFQAFQYVKDCEGVGFGVGFDQMFDIAVNSKLSKIVIFDISPATSLMTRMVLEVGRRHHELFSRYPTPQEYVAYFENDTLPMTLEMVEQQFDYEGFKALQNVLRREQRTSNNSVPVPTSNLFHTYLSLKADQDEFESWISTPGTIQHLLDMYEKKNIELVHADIAGEHGMSSVAEGLAKNGERVSVIYLSNVPGAVDRHGKREEFLHNVGLLPVNDDTVVIETDWQGGNLPSPKYLDDPRAKMLDFMPWSMQVQSMRAWRTHLLSASERDQLAASGENIPEIPWATPLQGLQVSGDIAKKQRIK